MPFVVKSVGSKLGFISGNDPDEIIDTVTSQTFGIDVADVDSAQDRLSVTVETKEGTAVLFFRLTTSEEGKAQLELDVNMSDSDSIEGLREALGDKESPTDFEKWIITYCPKEPSDDGLTWLEVPPFTLLCTAKDGSKQERCKLPQDFECDTRIENVTISP